MGIAFAAALAGILIGSAALQRVAGQVMPDMGTHGAWYASRAAGVAAYLFLWLGLAGGLLMSSAWFDGLVGRAKLLAIHQAASIAGILLGFGHGLVLIQDPWTHFGLVDVLVPFGSYYKTSLTGIGQASLYLGTIVSASFWFRSAIGIKTWRYIHYSSFVAFIGALWHGIQMGTDSHETWLVVLYMATSLSIVSGIVVRLTYTRTVKRRVIQEVSAA